MAASCGPSPDPGDDLPSVSPGTPDGVFEDTGAVALDFQGGTELTVVTGRPVTLHVEVTPRGRHTVRFALLDDPVDAFVSDGMVATDASGVAETTLTALTHIPGGFALRAAAGRAERVLRVSTLQASVANLVVTPRYPGARAVETWVASIHLDLDCGELEGVPFPDGPETYEAENGRPVRITGVPANRELAVVVRARYFAGGCRNMGPLRAGADTLTDIDVMDRPLQISDLALDLAFGIAPNEALDELAFRGASALIGPAADDLAALLDAMSTLSADPAAFEQARAQQNWRGVLVAGLDPALPGAGLRNQVQAWMQTGIAGLGEPDAFGAGLRAEGAANGAALVLSSVAGLSPLEAGFAPDNLASISVAPNDFLLFEASLSWQPAPFLAAVASRAALAEDPTRDSAADGLAEAFGCTNVAELLVAAGSSPGEAFAGCGEACVRDLCERGMQLLWDRIADAELPVATWEMSGSAPAEIDAEARPSAVDGTWVGSLTLDEVFGSRETSGPFSGRAAPE